MLIKTATMKRTISIILFSLCMAHAYSQSGWPSVGAKWHYSYQPCSIWGCSSSIKEYIYFEAVKDTLLNDTLCTKLIVEYHNDKKEVKYLGDEFIFSTENQVYNYHHGRFYLLYDFSVQVGDSVVLTLGSNCQLYDKLEKGSVLNLRPIKHFVIKRDSVVINGEKYLYIDFEITSESNVEFQSLLFDNSIIIKGIGSLEFLTGNLFTGIESGYYGPYAATAIQQ
jgi:hypothetical protein